jgi:CubicO group peptidase (beta-lactamase class C family)
VNAADADLISALTTFISREMAYSGVPGVTVALGKQRDLLWSGAFGFADLATRRAVTPTCVFKSGSMGKAYTGAAIMQLIEAGVVALDQPVNELLPFRVENPFGGEIEVHHLLTHTSGLGTTLVDSCTRPEKHRPLARVLAEFVQREHDVPFGGETHPIWIDATGHTWRYSNLGVGLLGLIVEAQNGKGLSFSEYVQRNIMDRLGMEHAVYPAIQAAHALPSAVWERMMTGYTVQGGVAVPAAPNYFQIAPAGGFVSTAADHLRFMLAMMNGGDLNGRRILSADSVSAMLSPRLTRSGPDGRKVEQGLIWALTSKDGRTQSFGHGGGHMYGFRTQCAAWPDAGVAVVVACNYWPLGVEYFCALPQRITDFIGDWLELGAAGEHDGSRTWAWKLSYLRGARFIEANNHALGLVDPLKLDDVLRAARDAAVGPAEDWDEDAFVAGAADMLDVPASAAAITAFAQSLHFRLSATEARRALWFLEGAPDKRIGIWHSYLGDA